MAREGTGPALTAAWTYLSAAEELTVSLWGQTVTYEELRIRG